MAIHGFRAKWLEDLFVCGRSAKAPQKHVKKILRLLDMLDAADDLKDLQAITGFHGLKGDRKGTCSVTVTGNYRITFCWDDGNVYDVDYEDYH